MSVQTEIEGPRATRSQLAQRLLLLVVLLALENTIVVQIPHPWFTTFLYRGIPIVFGLALLFFGRSRLRTLQPPDLVLSVPAAILHAGLVLLFAALEGYLVRFYGVGDPQHLRVATWLWVALLPALVVSLIVTFLPARSLAAIARALGAAWAYAAGCSIFVVVLREALRLTWDKPWDGRSAEVGRFIQTACFHQTRSLLHLFYPAVVSVDAAHILGTPRFNVEISGVCSGIEGLVLITVLMLGWILFARRELRVGRALLLLPLGAALMWSLNLVRIVALIAIGDAGHPDVAVNGFHTEAGWIAFNLVSLALIAAAQRVMWFRKDSHAWPAPPATDSPNLPAVYLTPFLAITAASVVTTATSSGFEWLYPLRLVAAVVALWAFRRHYRNVDWSFGIAGVAGGIAVAAMWLGLHSFSAASGVHPATILETGLQALPPFQRIAWTICRVFAAVVTVPIAEELAFRGFIARRILSPDVETISYTRLNLLSVAVSSVAFGLMHGQMWFAGIVAGVIFALAAKFRGRLGDAVAAHAIANLAIAIVVLARGDYSLW